MGKCGCQRRPHVGGSTDPPSGINVADINVVSDSECVGRVAVSSDGTAAAPKRASISPSSLLLSSMANCSHSVVEGGAVSTNQRRAEINELKARLVYETESSVKAHLHGRIARLETLEGLY